MFNCSLKDSESLSGVNECLTVDGLTVSDFLEIAKAPDGQRTITAIKLLEKKGLPVEISLEVGQSFKQSQGFLDFDLVKVSRQHTMFALQRREKNMPVGDSFRTANLPRSVETAAPHDRFLALAKFQGNQRRGENVLGIYFVMAEIDDPVVREIASDFGLDALPAMAKEHAITMAKAMALFAGEIALPFLVTYSGGKSFHCLWQWDRPLSIEEAKTIRKAKDYLVREAKERPRHELEPLLKADPQPLFSATALCRIPCDIAELGRNPQIAWRTGANGVLSKKAILSAAEAINERFGCIDTLKAIQTHQRAVFDRFEGNQQRVSDADVQAAFPEPTRKARSGDGYAVRCPFHDDTTHSAFVSGAGFIYCSVCSDASNHWIGRVFPGGRIEKIQK